MAGFDAGGPDAADQLADAEIKISHAVLDYAHDARGGRINPTRISKNLDPTLALPKPHGSDRVDLLPLRSGGVSAQLPAPAAAIRAAAQEADRAARRRQARPKRRSPRSRSRAARSSSSASRIRKSRCCGPGSTCPHGQNPELYDEAVLEAVKTFQARAQHRGRRRGRLRHAAAPQPAASAQHGQPRADQDHPPQHGALALAAPGSGQLLRHRQHSGVHAARGQ